MESPAVERPTFLDTSRLTALGGSFWYLISAGLMLWGIGMILLPAFESEGNLFEKLLALTTLNVYQWMLVGLVILLAVWRRVVDDAVLLTLLDAAFTIAIAAGLDTVAASLPMPVFAVGVGLMVLATLKLDLLSRLVIARPTASHLVALAALLAINFLLPGAMGIAKSQEAQVSPDQLVTVHMVLRGLVELGWIVFVVAGLFLVLHLERRPAGHVHHADLGQSALTSATMRWLITLVTLGATAGHLWALAWSFDLDVTNGDILPVAAASALLAIALARGYGWMSGMVAKVGLTVTLLLAIHSSANGAGHTDLLAMFSLANPVVVLMVVGGALAVLAMLRRSHGLSEWCVVFVTAAALLCTAHPATAWARHVDHLAWPLAGLTATCGLLILAGCWLRLRYVAVAVVTGAATLGAWPGLQAFFIDGPIGAGEVMCVVALTGLLTLQAVAQRLGRSDAWLTRVLSVSWVIALMVGMSALTSVGQEPEVAPTSLAVLPFVVALLATMYLALLAWISSERWLPAAGLVLFAWAAWVGALPTAWVLIALAFAALAIGGCMSLRRAEHSPAQVA